MTGLHTLMVIGVVFIWGTNFVPVRWGLDEFPPFTFAAMRFVFAVVPWILVVRRPQVGFGWLALFGLLVGVGQFGLLYYAMGSDISPGLASLLMQCQVFFTIGLAAWLFNERLSAASLAGLVVAVLGLVVIGRHLDASVTPKGVIVVLLAAGCWALANLAIKRAAQATPGGFHMVSFMVWSSLFAVPPLAALAALMDGPGPALDSLRSATARGWAVLIWQSVGNTLVGFGVWMWLLTRYKADRVTPYALLVPVFGMGASAAMLGEPMPAWKLEAGALILGGLAIHAFAPMIVRRGARAPG